MISPGSLQLSLRCDGGRVSGITVDNSRPMAARLLAGRTPQEVVGLAAMLFSLCGRAQGVAARLALEAAQGRTPAAGDPGERAIAAEAAQEHLWRLLLDWPQVFARAPQRSRFAALHRRLNDSDGDLDAVATEIGALVDESGVCSARADEADALPEQLGTAGELGRMLAQAIGEDRDAPAPVRSPLMPMQSAAAWAEALGGEMPSDAFCARPTLAGETLETGALARQQHVPSVTMLRNAGRCVAARFAARLAELGQFAGRLRGVAPQLQLADGAPLAPGVGLSRVETARGLLMHAVRLERGRVAQYAIVAPTEWNFHPEGPFVREATAVSFEQRGAALAFARRLALSLDPCVAWDVVLEDETDA